MTEKPVDEMSFEEAMAELEQVVNKLDSGQASLKDSITLYERGAALKARCTEELKRAEEKIEQITLDAEGKPTGTKSAEGM